MNTQNHYFYKSIVDYLFRTKSQYSTFTPRRHLIFILKLILNSLVKTYDIIENIYVLILN